MLNRDYTLPVLSYTCASRHSSVAVGLLYPSMAPMTNHHNGFIIVGNGRVPVPTLSSCKGRCQQAQGLRRANWPEQAQQIEWISLVDFPLL